MVHFQLRSFINAGLMERSLYNRFCNERCAKMGFLVDFGGGAKIFGENLPRNAITADLRRLAKNVEML